MSDLIGFKSVLIENGDIFTPLSWCQTYFDGTRSPQAECVKHVHTLPPPRPDCWCGFHASADAEAALVVLDGCGMELEYWEQEAYRPILTLARAEGDVEVHKRGFRAEQVEIVGAVSPHPIAKMMDLLDSAKQARRREVGEYIYIRFPPPRHFLTGFDLLIECHMVPAYSYEEAKALVEYSHHEAREGDEPEPKIWSVGYEEE